VRLWIALALLWCGGCALWPPPDAAPDPTPLSKGERAALVADLIAALDRPFPPAKTTLALPADDPADVLMASLAQALREAGYGMAEADGREAVLIRLQMQALPDTGLWVRLDAGSAWQWTRLYERRGTGLAPLSGPTVRVE